MSLSVFIARRLPLGSDRGPGSGGIAVSVTGITLSVIVMLLSISIITGFREEIRNKIIGFDAQITLYPTDGEAAIDLNAISDVLATLPEGTTVSPTIR